MRVQVYLEADGREMEARLVGARLERTQLQQVAKRIKIVHKPFLIGKMGGFVQARTQMLLPTDSAVYNRLLRAVASHIWEVGMQAIALAHNL